jgi:hypothetical protein
MASVTTMPLKPSESFKSFVIIREEREDGKSEVLNPGIFLIVICPAITLTGFAL